MTIKEAVNTIAHFCDYIIPCDEYGYRISGELVEAHTMAVRALQGQGWIPVTERLPEGECLAISMLEGPAYKEMMIGYIEEEPNCDTGYVCESTAEILPNVTHWMPPPEPPKEVE